MKQYCRYCAHMVCGNGNYCEIKHDLFSDEKIKRVNKCKHFEFCKMDALDLDHIYKPRKPYRKREEAQGEQLFLTTTGELRTIIENKHKSKKMEEYYKLLWILDELDEGFEVEI